MANDGWDEVDACKISTPLEEEMRGHQNTRNSSGMLSSESRLPELTSYEISANRRKLAVVISNVKFDVKTEIPKRRFGKVDERAMVNILENILGFENAVVKRNHTEDELHQLFEEISTSWDFSDVDLFVCAFMTYGDNRTIYTSSGDAVDVKVLLDYLKGDKCPQLVGKPKVVFINAAMWREEPEEMETASGGYEVSDAMGNGISSPPVTDQSQESKIRIPKESDFIYVYSPIISGHGKSGSAEQGNTFLTTFSEICLRHAHDHEICDLLTRTNYEMARHCARSQNGDTAPSRPCFFLSTLTKELYLKPKN